MDRSLLVLSDAHLSRKYGRTAGVDLATLLARYPDVELVLAGDIFDLSLDGASVGLVDSLDRAVAPHAAALEALRSHVARGSKVTIVPGNHDAGLHHQKVVERVRYHLGATDERTVEVSPWFIRRGDIHIEHGHLYDPDCAPNHPLTPGNPLSEGLGTALMRRFVAPHDALFFAHANQMTFVPALKKTIKTWGRRAPSIMLDYFRTAGRLCLEARTQRPLVQLERQLGHEELASHALRTGVPPSTLGALLTLAPTPTHHSLRATFLRLYFDRILALASLGSGLGVLGGAGLGLVTGASLLSPVGALTKVGALLSALGGGYLSLNTAIEKNRYGDKVIGQLGKAAHLVREATDCRLVVFGHTHVEVNEPGYVNLGSFGYGRPARPYLLVAPDGRHERAFFPHR